MSVVTVVKIEEEKQQMLWTSPTGTLRELFLRMNFYLLAYLQFYLISGKMLVSRAFLFS